MSEFVFPLVDDMLVDPDVGGSGTRLVWIVKSGEIGISIYHKPKSIKVEVYWHCTVIQNRVIWSKSQLEDSQHQSLNRYNKE